MNRLLLALPGLAIGVGVNWLADLLPKKAGLDVPSCSACGAPRSPRAWSALVAPLTGSWRCPYCGRRRHFRDVAVELAMAAAAVAIAWGSWGPSGYLPALFITAVFLLITIIDVEHRLILHVVSLPSILLVGAIGALHPSVGPLKTLLGGVAGFGATFALFLLGAVFARWVADRRDQPLEEVAFGFGDVTLGTLIGVAVGWPGVVLALTIGVLAAGVFSLAYLLWMLVRGRYQPYLPIPYGPFLILGALLVYLGGRDLFLSLLG